MNDQEQLKARLAMFVSGVSGWLDAAEEERLDADAIKEVEKAHEHARNAFRILEGKEE